MKTFSYTARKQPGETVAGCMDAESSVAVAHSLRIKGYFPIEIQPHIRRSGVFSLIRGGTRRGVKLSHLAEFAEQFAGLLDAGVPLERALRLLGQQMANRAFKDILPLIADAVRDGDSLAQAFTAFPKVFPETFVSMIDVGEQAGLLVEILKRQAQSLDDQDKLQSKLKGAMVYPAFLLSVGLLTIAVLMVWVIPKFSTFFVSLGQQLPLPTRIVIACSAVMTKLLPILVVLIFLLLFTGGRLLRKPSVRLFIDTLLLRIPVLGPFFAKAQLIQLMRTLGILLVHGVNMLTALKITGNTLSNRLFSSEIQKAAERLAHGTKLHECFAFGVVFPETLVGLLAIGQESGNLPQMLSRVGDQYEQQIERQIRSFTSMIEPVMIMLMGGVVGFVVVAMLLPVFKASALVK